jgi:hypothetical protein
MKKIKNLFCCLAVMYCLILTSCAQTTTLSAWKDESYGGQIKKILIIGASEKPGVRRMFEQEFANQLKPYGITALPSNQILPADKMLDRETIISKIEGRGIDAVLVTDLVERKMVKTYRSDWYNHQTRTYGRYFEDEIVNLETSLYDVKTEKLVWSALSETTIMEEDSTYGKIKEFIKSMVEKLSKNKLI